MFSISFLSINNKGVFQGENPADFKFSNETKNICLVLSEKKSLRLDMKRISEFCC